MSGMLLESTAGSRRPAAADPPLAREARALLAEWKSASAAYRRQCDAVDALNRDLAPLGEIRAAERLQCDLCVRRADVEEKIAGFACRALGRPPLCEGEKLAVFIDGWCFPLEGFSTRPSCQDVIAPGDVLAIGGGR
jgi:hypothetical protein